MEINANGTKQAPGNVMNQKMDELENGGFQDGGITGDFYFILQDYLCFITFICDESINYFSLVQNFIRFFHIPHLVLSAGYYTKQIIFSFYM